MNCACVLRTCCFVCSGPALGERVRYASFLLYILSLLRKFLVGLRSIDATTGHDASMRQSDRTRWLIPTQNARAAIEHTAIGHQSRSSIINLIAAIILVCCSRHDSAAPEIISIDDNFAIIIDIRVGAMPIDESTSESHALIEIVTGKLYD